MSVATFVSFWNNESIDEYELRPKSNETYYLGPFDYVPCVYAYWRPFWSNDTNLRVFRAPILFLSKYAKFYFKSQITSNDDISQKQLCLFQRSILLFILSTSFTKPRPKRWTIRISTSVATFVSFWNNELIDEYELRPKSNEICCLDPFGYVPYVYAYWRPFWSNDINLRVFRAPILFLSKYVKSYFR